MKTVIESYIEALYMLDREVHIKKGRYCLVLSSGYTQNNLNTSENFWINLTSSLSVQAINSLWETLQKNNLKKSSIIWIELPHFSH